MEKPPVIVKQHTKGSLRRVLLFCLFSAILAAGLLAFLVWFAMPRPPKEKQLIQDFHRNRAAFEELRVMLQADERLCRVARWGVEMRNPFYLGEAAGGVLPAERYRRYLVLLKQVGGRVASRDAGKHAHPSVGVWGWGWAGNTRHIDICWMDEAPTNQIPSLDGYRSKGPRSFFPEGAFRHVDENWYLWTDL